MNPHHEAVLERLLGRDAWLQRPRESPEPAPVPHPCFPDFQELGGCPMASPVPERPDVAESAHYPEQGCHHPMRTHRSIQKNPQASFSEPPLSSPLAPESDALISSARCYESSLQLLVPNLKKRVPTSLGTAQEGERAI